MSEFNDIEKMTGMVSVLSPFLADDLGVLINPEDGSETTTPAIYLDGNFVPQSTLPRVVLSFNGSQNGHITGRSTYQEPNPDYDPQDPDSPEFLYFIERQYHTEFSLTFAIDAGDTTEVLTGNRKSASYIARKIRKLLGRNSIRDSLHTLIESGIDYIAEETPQTDQDGVVLVDSSVVVINMTTLDTDTEQVDGVIERVRGSGELYRVDDSDPDPLEVDFDVTDPTV